MYENNNYVNYANVQRQISVFLIVTLVVLNLKNKGNTKHTFWFSPEKLEPNNQDYGKHEETN